MPFFIAEPCIDVMDKSCVDECPVDCIYEGGRKLYINPAECIDCGACELACPVTAIHGDRELNDALSAQKKDNARFFNEPLPGRDASLGNPGGAIRIGPVGVDTELTSRQPVQTEA